MNNLDDDLVVEFHHYVHMNRHVDFFVDLEEYLLALFIAHLNELSIFPASTDKFGEVLLSSYIGKVLQIITEGFSVNLRALMPQEKHLSTSVRIFVNYFLQQFVEVLST